MTVRSARLFLVLILVVATAPRMETQSGTGSPRRDGNWWLTYPTSSKPDYVVGFFDGMSLGNHFSQWTSSGESIPVTSVEGATIQRRFEANVDQYMKNISSGQVVDGLDAFYADFRNRRIFVSDAVWVIVNQIRGTPKDRIDKLIENSRLFAK